MNAPQTDRGAALFSTNTQLIDRIVAFVCARRHVGATEGDDFTSHVHEKLIENNYAILMKFEGRSSLRTFLTAVVQHLFLDYRIRHWGKWRPSADAVRLGPVAVQLEQLLTKDNHTFEEACELLKTKHRVPAARGELERLAGQLPARAPRRFESDESLANAASHDRPPDEAIEAKSVAAALESALSSLDPQDRLIIALRYEDGRGVTDIARLLGVDIQGLFRRIDRVLKQLRLSLEDAGLDRSSIAKMFEAPAVAVDWKGESREKSRSQSPSIESGRA